MEKELRDYLDDLEFRVRQTEALVLALIEKLDEQNNRSGSVRHEYQNKAKKLGINSQYPG